MSNPKVFEFAKEIGMTPLALMDKIKEWQIPIKNHMAELEPEVLEKIKTKLSGPSKGEGEEKPKKTAARKPAAAKKEAAPASEKPAVKKAPAKAPAKAAVKAAPAADTGSVKTPVIRRKTKEMEAAAAAALAPAADDTKAKVISRPEVEAPIIETIVSSPDSVIEPTIAEPPPIAEKTFSPITPATGEKLPPAISRKKEVSIGDSGVSSSASIAIPKRNIIGRMDLSRVQGPQGAGGGGGGVIGTTGGYTRGAGGPRTAGPGFPASSPGGFNARPPSGGMGGNRTSGRNIRPGFVAQMPDTPPPPMTDFDSRRQPDKNKRFGGGPVPAPTGGLTAKEKEAAEILQSFNAVEFRKREMVFQPKKKTGTLNRTAMKTQLTTPKASKRVLKVNGKMKVSDIANEMGIKAGQLVKALMSQGVMANMNMDLDFDTIALILPELGWEAQNVFQTADDIVTEMAFGEMDAAKIIRPPVVTVMGHVDHGKTSLLDAIRNADVASGEAGGITQHIGAYSVHTEDGSLITFLDTPGHEAFTAMRARGANATDIAIIVVAADDGLMPQTAEAINHAKAAGVPMIIAVNKMDKPGANPDRVKQQLTEFEIVPEEWGGNTIFSEVSALKRTGIKELLENIKLLAEVAELKANPERSGTGMVIESKLEKGRGPVATILVKDGTVKIGQYIVAGSMKGRVKSLTNDKGERIESVTPGLPAEVLGLEGVPSAGDRFDVVVDEKTAEQVVDNRKQATLDSQVHKKISLEDMFNKVTQGDIKDFNIVLKADVDGSLEAIKGMLNKLTSAEVKNKIIHAAVGGVTENDVMLAHTSKGIVIGFNVRPDNNAQARAKQLGVDVRTYSIVYEMVDEIRKAMTGLLAPQVIEKVMGTAEVRNIFSVPKLGQIAGSFVKSGKIQRSNMLRLVRDGKIVYEGKLASLKRFKDDAKEVAEGFECGIGIENFADIKVGDMIEAFAKEEIAREMTALQ
ncbi:MAG: translation initiation factor IF-2 [Bdellovibrionaceae bacterium]|nr:translation initiation factor IF-2 [Bdellovibrio sp.]